MYSISRHRRRRSFDSARACASASRRLPAGRSDADCASGPHARLPALRSTSLHARRARSLAFVRILVPSHALRCSSSMSSSKAVTSRRN
eukprot:1365245-Prymnesium_polylepis.1